jgi:hypothetical protein
MKDLYWASVDEKGQCALGAAKRKLVFCVYGGSSAIRKCALSSALFRRVEVPLALK